jgi:hypothetical protein
VATLKAIYDQESGRAPILIRTQEELEAMIDRVRAYSTGYPCPAIVELTVVEDPWGSPRLYAGIGEDRGYVQELWNPSRTTLGNSVAQGVVVYDLQGNPTDVPAEQEVPLSTVRVVLAAYLANGGRIPADFTGLQPVD